MGKIKVVGFLQNAWSTYWTDHWPRDLWLEALKKSRTGQRLRLLECEELDIWYDESTPKIADNPRTVLPADTAYMRKVLSHQKPEIIICFGVPAGNAMKEIRPEYEQPIMFLPHPTYRMVTNEVFTTALQHLKGGYTGYKRYMPKNGGGVTITAVDIPTAKLFIET